jgi:hypothetical protein
MKNSIYILALLAILFTSCSKNNDLDDSIFIRDEDDPELPQYSEWGYNTFGAFIDRDVFVSTDDDVPFKVKVTNDGLALTMNGQFKPCNDDKYDDCDCDDDNDKRENEDMRMVFIFPGFKPTNYKDLLVLNDTLFDLTEPNCKVYLTSDSVDDTLEIISGEIIFKRAQNLVVDKEEMEVILSGTFEFKPN